MVLVMKDSPLSKRGSELSVLGSQFAGFKAFFDDLYNPDTNPNGIVSLRVSENVTVPSVKGELCEREISITALLVADICSF